MKFLKPLLLVILTIGLAYFGARLKDPMFRFNLQSDFTLSAGDRYYHRLRYWYSLARSGNWPDAAIVENGLDQTDLAAFKSANQPEELKKLINTMTMKKNKTVEDWLELARIQFLVGKTADALESVKKAHELDPVREDIAKLYYQLVK